jgi:hypothetical protein
MSDKQIAQLIMIVMGLVITTIGIYLGFIWLGWRFMLVTFLLMFSNNINLAIGRNR